MRSGHVGGTGTFLVPKDSIHSTAKLEVPPEYFSKFPLGPDLKQSWQNSFPDQGTVLDI